MKRKPNPNLPEIERLERNLEDLSFCCKPVDDVPRRRSGEAVPRLSGSYELGYWPSRELLEEIDYDVAVIALHCSPKVRGFSLAWKEFKYVDEQMPKLRLESHVENLISRAHDMLPPSESELGKAARLASAGDTQARFSLRDMAEKSEKFYKLLQADRRTEIQRWLAKPLAKWIVTSEFCSEASGEHPLRKHFVSAAGVDLPWKDRAEFKRWRDSNRQRRHRLKKNLRKKRDSIPASHKGKFFFVG